MLMDCNECGASFDVNLPTKIPCPYCGEYKDISNNWIDLDKHTPHTGEFVLVVGPSGPYIAFLSDKGWFMQKDTSNIVPVTYWMPIPDWSKLECY